MSRLRSGFQHDFTELPLGAVEGAVGILAAKQTAKYMTGARVILKINNRIAAFATGVSWNIVTEGKEIWTIDNYVPHEIAPTRISVDGTISGLIIPGQGVSNELFQADVLSFLFHKYITIEVRDSQTNALLFLTKRAQIVSRSEDVGSGELGNIRLSWRAVGWRDDKMPKYPKGYQSLR